MFHYLLVRAISALWQYSLNYKGRLDGISDVDFKVNFRIENSSQLISRSRGSRKPSICESVLLYFFVIKLAYPYQILLQPKNGFIIKLFTITVKILLPIFAFTSTEKLNCTSPSLLETMRFSLIHSLFETLAEKTRRATTSTTLFSMFNF